MRLHLRVCKETFYQAKLSISGLLLIAIFKLMLSDSVSVFFFLQENSHMVQCFDKMAYCACVSVIVIHILDE